MSSLRSVHARELGPHATSYAAAEARQAARLQKGRVCLVPEPVERRVALLVEKRKAMKKVLDLRDNSEPKGAWHTEVLHWTRMRVAAAAAANSQLFAAVPPVQ